MLLIKGLICKLKEQMSIHKHHVEWMKRNTHNKTWQVGVFPHNHVEVGNGTYGPINVSVNEKDGKCIIGNFCSIAPDVRFMISCEHPLQYISTYPFKTKYGFHGESDAISKGDIIVEDDVWIGEGVRILSGVKIGQGAVIGTGAVVTHDIPPYAVCGGVPAKVIKYRFSEDIIDEMKKIDYSKLNEKMIRENINRLYEEITDKSQIDWLPKK